MSEEKQGRARELFQRAYEAQMAGELDRAVELYKRSIETYPTAEAHTFLGWTYHSPRDTAAAIAECKRAIEVDPTFGNPYNDIGAYLIDLGRYDEAVSWLEQAIRAPRYEPRHFSHFNLGRVYLAKGMFFRARECFRNRCALSPTTLLRGRPSVGSAT